MLYNTGHPVGWWKALPPQPEAEFEDGGGDVDTADAPDLPAFWCGSRPREELQQLPEEGKFVVLRATEDEDDPVDFRILHADPTLAPTEQSTKCWLLQVSSFHFCSISHGIIPCTVMATVSHTSVVHAGCATSS